MGDAAASADQSRDSADWIRAALVRHEKQLVAYAAHLVGDPDRGRDIVQEAFARLCTQDRSRVEPHLTEWLYRVCRNLAIDIRRKQRRMSLLSEEQAGALGSDGPEPGYAAERDDSYSAVLKAMGMLPKNQQEVIRLKFQHGMSYKEISSVTQLTVTNVGFLIHTGLKTLRERLADAGPAAGRATPGPADEEES